MLRSAYKYIKLPVDHFAHKRSTIGVIGQRRVVLRSYSATEDKQVNSAVGDKQAPKSDINIVKAQQIPENSQGGDNGSSSSNKTNFKNILLYLSPVVAAAVIYQLWSITSKQDQAKDLNELSEINKRRKKRKEWVSRKHPMTSADIPSQVPYLLIGGGTAAFSAFRAIKSNDPSAQILMISNEPYYPYMRPPLSKEMFYDDDRDSVRKLKFKQWNGKQRSLFYEHEDFYADIDLLMSAKNGGVAVARGWTVRSVDAANRKAYLEDGKEISYRKCLIATGAKPKNLPIFENASEEIKDKVMLYRNIYDFEELEDIMNEGAKSIAIVGGGFLGSELACALARRGKSLGLTVHQIYREEGNMGKVLPEYLSKWTTEKVKREGVNVISKAEVSGVELEGQRLQLTLNNGNKVAADHVIVAVGVEPNTELAQTSNLEVDPEVGGFLVNAELEARSNLYIAGDCACFYDVKLGRRRIEHHDNAVVSGRLAGENMTGAAKAYLHQSMLWSDLGPDVGYEALGIVDSSLHTFAVYAKSDNNGQNQSSTGKEDDYGKGVIFYLKDDIIVGMVLWNVFNRMGIARQVLNEARKFEDLNEVAKLFDIHAN